MSKEEDDLVVRGSLSASFENVYVLPSNPRPGRTVFYIPDGSLYFSNGERWLEISSGLGGGSSYYFIASGKTVEVDAGSVLNLVGNLTLDGTIFLDGMIADSA